MSKKILNQFIPTAEAISRLLYPHAEVVLHDVKRNTIVAIYNSLSKRKNGDDSMLTPDEMPSIDAVTGPYEKRNWNGHRLKCTSSLIYDENKKVIGLLCINLDIDHLENMHQLIEQFIGSAQRAAQPDPLFRDDWQERINQYIHQYLQKENTQIATLTRLQKQLLVQHLYHIGAFEGKNAAKYIGTILDISRATVYQYLKELEKV